MSVVLMGASWDHLKTHISGISAKAANCSDKVIWHSSLACLHAEDAYTIHVHAGTVMPDQFVF